MARNGARPVPHLQGRHGTALWRDKGQERTCVQHKGRPEPAADHQTRRPHQPLCCSLSGMPFRLRGGRRGPAWLLPHGSMPAPARRPPWGRPGIFALSPPLPFLTQPTSTSPCPPLQQTLCAGACPHIASGRLCSGRTVAAAPARWNNKGFSAKDISGAPTFPHSPAGSVYSLPLCPSLPPRTVSPHPRCGGRAGRLMQHLSC